MQLSLDGCKRNLLVIGLKADWDPNASSFEIYGKFAKTDLKLNQEEYVKNYPQDVDIHNRTKKSKNSSMLVKYYSLEHKNFIFNKSSVLNGTGMKLIHSFPPAYQGAHRNFEQQERDMRIKYPKGCCLTKIETRDGWMTLK